MEFIVERSVLAAGLSKVNYVLKDVDLSSVTKNVLIEIHTDHLMLGATNLEITVRVKVPLFEAIEIPEGTNPVLVVPGKVFLEAVEKSSDNSLVITVEDTNCIVKGRHSYKRICGIASKDYPSKMLSVTDGNPFKMGKEVFLQSLRAAEEFMGKDPIKPIYMVVQVNTNRMESTDGYVVCIYGMGENPIPQRFTIPAKEVEPIRGILSVSGSDEIEIRIGAAMGQIAIGNDTIVFSLSNVEWKDMNKSVLDPTSGFKLIFKGDKGSLVSAIEEANIFSEENFCIKMEKRGLFLTLSSTDAVGNNAAVDVPVTWVAPDDFKLLVSWKTLVGVLKVLNEEVVNFGVVDYKGRECIRVEETGVIIVILSLIEKVAESKPKAKKKGAK